MVRLKETRYHLMACVNNDNHAWAIINSTLETFSKNGQKLRKAARPLKTVGLLTCLKV